jgi:CheY-like chemotaxis protein
MAGAWQDGRAAGRNGTGPCLIALTAHQGRLMSEPFTSPPTDDRAILIIDADADAREVISVALTGHGYQVAGCSSGLQALHYLRSHANVSVILLDLMVPIIAATKFRAAQLRDRSLAWIPIVVMSAAVDAARDAERLGARAFVRKPIDLDQLRATLHRVGGLQKRLPEAERRGVDRS